MRERERNDTTRRPGRELSDQIVESGFPSGVAVPSTVVAVGLVLLAVLAVVLLSPGPGADAPAEVVRHQERIAHSSAQAMAAVASQGTADLRAIGATGAKPEALLDSLLKDRRWRGAAVFDGTTRSLVAVRGEPVPLDALPSTIDSATVVTLLDSQHRLRFVGGVPLRDNRMLVAVAGPRPQRGETTRTLVVADQNGQIIETSGPAIDQKRTELIGQAAAAGGEGSVLGDVHDGLRTVVAHAQIPVTVQGDTRLSVVVIADVPVIPPPGGLLRMAVAGSLVLLACLVLLVVRLGLVRPVARLRADALAIAGGSLDGKVRLPGGPELRRVAAAVERCRRTMRGVSRPTRPAPGSRWKSATVVVSVASALVLGWAAGLLTVVFTHPTSVPPAVADSLRDQTDHASDRVRRVVTGGLADLRGLAGLASADAKVDLGAALDGLVEGRQRFRSAYLVDHDGGITRHAGRDPLRGGDRPDSEPRVGVHDAGRVPVLYASVPLPDGAALVAEFDHDYLSALLGRGPGRVRLVDGQARTIAASGGFVAFEQVGVEAQGTVSTARSGPPVANVHPDAVVAAGAVTGDGLDGMGWVVLSEQSVDDLALAGNDVRRGAVTVALVGLILGLALFGWQFLLHVKPLRALADSADKVRDGEGDVVFPQHHDEIGTLACCVEVCRQAIADGRDRLGGVRRPGSATDPTQLISRVPAQASRR